YDIYVAGKFGITNPRLWHVVRGLTVVPETAPDNTQSAAQAVGMNVAISGQADGNNQDLFKFPAKAGQRIVVDCLSARLETEMDATLTVYGPAGQQLASNSDYFGRDPLLDFIA